MRKIKIALFSCLSLFSLVGVSFGVTYAAYNAPSESHTVQFGSMTASDHNFQELGYYFAGGSGTEGSPYLIKNSQQLRNLSKLQNSGALPAATYVSLGTSFQYEGDNLDPIGTSTYPFTGVFNGNGHSITGLTVSTNATTYVGMFGVVGTNTATGTVHSLVLVGPSVTYTGNSAVKIAFVCGSKNTTAGHVSVVQNIEIYGGTANFSGKGSTKNIRARIKSSGTATYGDGVVAVGGSTNAGFVSVLSATPSYGSTLTYSGGITTGTQYYLYNNGSNVVNG